MADNTLVNEEALLTTSPSILADIANDPAEDSLLASDDEDIPCGQMSTERRKNTNPQENGDQPLQRNRKTNNTERRNGDPTEDEISDKETTFLDTYIYKGERFERDAILDVRTHFKPTETFQYTHFASCHPQGVKKGFIKGEALRLLRTNSSKLIFEEKITNFKAHLLQRGYPEDLINTTLSEVNFKDRKLALQQKPKTNQRILPFVTQYQPSVLNLKQIHIKNSHLIEQQPLLSEIYKEPPLVSYKRGRLLKDILVRAKL